ncbi:MAG: hypothetical protein LBT01_01930 [Spirochaetaceae bacterium]|jgi:hypothetical protein|nr:hypothetical protein [Spirochaetaceae bacterium]
MKDSTTDHDYSASPIFLRIRARMSSIEGNTLTDYPSRLDYDTTEMKTAKGRF